MVSLESSKTPLGIHAHEFSLPGTDGNTYSLNSFQEAKILVIVFMCNHCPYVQAVLQRLNRLSEEFHDQNVQFVGINANDATGYPEDSFENMKKLSIEFPYLYDESQEVAREYGAVCTPDIFVYDANKELIYRGRIDDNWKESENVRKRDLADAISKTLNNEQVPEEDQKPSMGCSIKWKEE